MFSFPGFVAHALQNSNARKLYNRNFQKAPEAFLTVSSLGMRREIIAGKKREDGMKKILNVLCTAVLAGVAAFASPVFAEDAKPTTIVLNADDIKKALGLSIYLQGGYNYNFNGPTSGLNDQRIFDQKANSFMLDLAQIVFAKDPATGTIGFKLKLSAGETAKYIHSTGLGASNNDLPFDMTEAYISYVAPLGKGIRFDFGKMATFIGAEVIEAKDNVNYSRSFLFNYAEPLTHTGLKVSYNVTDTLSTAIFALNGWDNSSDNNKGKSYGASIGFAPADAFSTSVNVISGPEQANNNSNYRTLVDLVATIKPIKPLTISLNYDYGYEANAQATGGAHWSGVSAIAKVDITDAHSVALRGEYFRDDDGFRTATAQHLKEVTLTWETKLAGGLILRPEYRHDWSNRATFDSTKKQQDTLALGVMYTW
jgi:hypothetical protein